VRPRMVSAREIVGKRIVRFDPGAKVDKDGRAYHDPTIHLDDGSYLYCVAEETPHLEYGIFMGRGWLRKEAQ
jgi:hypothetical protein